MGSQENIEYELQEHDGLVCRGERLILPLAARKNAMSGYTRGIGDFRMCKQGETIVFWFGMTS